MGTDAKLVIQDAKTLNLGRGEVVDYFVDNFPEDGGCEVPHPVLITKAAILELLREGDLPEPEVIVALGHALTYMNDHDTDNMEVRFDG